MAVDKIVIASVALGLLSRVVTSSPSCLDQSGNSVDWWAMYKFPKLTGNENSELAAGYGYAYMDKNSMRWTVATDTYLDDDNIALTYTMNQIYDASTTGDIGWGMYNDEKPDGTTSSYRGHAKGVAAFDSKGGFFIDHSVPNYPPFHTDGYEYPEDETTNGQSFLCLSVDSDNFNTIINSWLYVYPNWYDTYQPDSVVDIYPNMSAVFGGLHVKTEPWTNVATVKTLSGKALKYISKYSTWGKDFYEDLVAPTLDVGLRTETWQLGTGNMPSFCSVEDGGTYDYTVLNIKGIDLGSDISFTETKDHSKWAVSMDKTYPWVCVGDLNRQTGQESRAGGTLCMEQTAVWDAYNASISTVMPC